MKLQYIKLHVQQLQVRFLLLFVFGEGGWSFLFHFFFFNLSYGPSLWSILVTLNGSIYNWIFSNYNWPFEQTLYYHIHKGPTILGDLCRGYNSFWFILCEQIFSDTIARGVVANRKVGANFMRWRESGGVNFQTFKTEKQKKRSFGFKHPWFREDIWLNDTNSAFSKSLHKNVGGQKHFLKRGMCPIFCPLLLLGLIFKRHLAKITCPGHYRYTNEVHIHL
jgi:hypothetical protein